MKWETKGRRPPRPYAMKLSKPPPNGLEGRQRGGVEVVKWGRRERGTASLFVCPLAQQLDVCQRLQRFPPVLHSSACLQWAGGGSSRGGRGRGLSSSRGSMASTHLAPAALPRHGDSSAKQRGLWGALTWKKNHLLWWMHLIKHRPYFYLIYISSFIIPWPNISTVLVK